MQNDRYSNPGITIGACTWCYTEYVIGCSRAREQSVFCSKKCEIEARFWLLDVLKEVDKSRGKRSDQGSSPQP
jgi:hypothetical protein